MELCSYFLFPHLDLHSALSQKFKYFTVGTIQDGFLDYLCVIKALPLITYVHTFPQWKVGCISPLEYVNSLCTWKFLSFCWLSPPILLSSLKRALSIAKFKPNHTENKLLWKKILLLSVTDSVLRLVHGQT